MKAAEIGHMGATTHVRCRNGIENTMISGRDLYTVISSVVPLYVTMFLAYASVKWWKIFNPEQCAGINKFVAIFAVPLLSFEFISRIDPYQMNFRFIAADGISKVILLVVLSIWAKCSQKGSLDWVITLFSLSTLPNTLVMGIPLLKAMYGDSAENLMIQTVVLQCIIWYTLLLFLFEYRSAKMLMAQKFYTNAPSNINESVKVETEVLSVDGKNQKLHKDAKFDVDDEKIHLTVKKPSSSSILEGLNSATSSHRSQGLNSKPLTPARSINHAAGYTDVFNNSFQSPKNLQNAIDSGSNRAELVSMMSGRGLSPQECNNNTNCVYDGNTVINLECRTICSNGHLGLFSPNAMQLTKMVPHATHYPPKLEDDAKELHMFVWSSADMSDPVQPWEEVDMNEDFTLRNKYSMLQGELAGEKEGPKLSEFITRSTTTLPKLGSAESDGQAIHNLQPPAAAVMKQILNMVWHKLVHNPNSYASVIGMIWALTSSRWHVGMPQIVEGSITILSNAGLGMAMFSLGLFMALQPRIIACGTSLAVFGMLLRFLAGPTVMAIASVAVGLRGSVLHVSIVQAALPQGIVPFVFAREYNLHADILSTAVIFGMIISLPITLVYYLLLGL
eukprot:Gb_23207 [translate_table: standard]